MIACGTPSPYPPPADLPEAIEGWGANCGPAAIAALLGLTLAAVRPHLAGFENRGYMNPTHVKVSLRALGHEPRLTPALDRWPVTGLAFVQWGGPWRVVAEAYRHTHWIAVKDDWVYDVNGNQWAPRWWWEKEIAPLLARLRPERNGTWYVRTGYSVEVPCRS